MDNGEENEVLDRAMEYAGAVGVEVTNMLMAVNEKVKDLELQVPTQHTFGGNGLQNFIQDHQDHLEQLEDQLRDLMMMMNRAVEGLMI